MERAVEEAVCLLVVWVLLAWLLVQRLAERRVAPLVLAVAEAGEAY